MSHAATLKEIVAVAQLPALPQSAIALMQLSQDENNGPPEFAVPIEADPGLAGQVLRFVNSSYFGFSREISSVKLAITLVGVRTIKNFALWSAVFSLMPNPKCGPFDLRNLWQDSLRRGLFARGAGRLLKLKESEDLFAAALLQDLAVPLLAKELPDEYKELLDSRHGGHVRLSVLEQECFGWNHAQAGAEIVRRWKLPDEFAALIETHCRAEALRGDLGPAKQLVALSSLLPAASDEDWPEWELFQAGYAKIAPGQASLDAILAQVDKDFEEFAPVLKLRVPTTRLADNLKTQQAARQPA